MVTLVMEVMSLKSRFQLGLTDTTSLHTLLNFMITTILFTVTFLGGVYVGTRWSEKIKEVYYSIVSR